MIRKLLMSAAVLALSMPVSAAAPVIAPPITPIPAITAQQRQLAAQLVRVLNSEDLTRLQITKMLNDTLPKTMAGTPAFAAAEKAHPGITDAFIGAMRPVILEGTISRLPSLWARLEPLYARSFTVPELRTLVDFYTSPIGVRLIKAMGEGSDYSQMLGNMVARGSNKVTTEDLHAGIQTGVAATITKATDADMKAMIALGATSAGKKLPAINQQAQAEAAAWGNEEDPQLNAEVIKAVQGVVAKYTGKPVQ